MGPTHLIKLSGGAYSDGSTWENGSSKQYKENIRNLETDDAISALEELNPTRFYYKNDKNDEKLGFIAEDVPDLVATESRKGLSAMDITAVLVKVVQKQQKMIENQAKINAKLMKRIEKLEEE